MKELFINSYCHIKKKNIFINGVKHFSDNDSVDLRTFTKSAYKFLAPSYNKFFFFFLICKLGFLAAEVLLSDINFLDLMEEDVAIILSNSHSTLITDKHHQVTIDSYDNFFPSPSIFVYTLPNIMIGEISIRHKFAGENAFFIVEKFNPELITNHINNLFLTKKAKAAIGGWVNLSESDYETFLYWTSAQGNIPHNAFEINRLYNLNH
jgi:hypothetical protein